MAARKRDSERIRDSNRNPALPPKGKEASAHRVTWEQFEFLCDTVEVPAGDPEWHPIARQWYDSLSMSGQHVYYEPSDWAAAWVIAESISRDMKPQYVGMTHPAPGSQATSEPVYESIPLKGASLTSYMRAFASLMVTETQRRDFRVEVERQRVNAVIAPTLHLAPTRDEAFSDEVG